MSYNFNYFYILKFINVSNYKENLIFIFSYAINKYNYVYKFTNLNY